MDRITTTIDREWLAAIITREKKVEYRAMKPYWRKRLEAVSRPFALRLINGMQTRALEVTVLIDRVRANRRTREYALHIKKVLGFKNWDAKHRRPRKRRRVPRDGTLDALSPLAGGRDREEQRSLGYEDPVYRFYHQSFEVYHLQEQTKSVVTALGDLAPDRPLNPWFLEIVAPGNRSPVHARAQLPLDGGDPSHRRGLLSRTVLPRDGGSLLGARSPPRPLPSGYAALPYLYGLR